MGELEQKNITKEFISFAAQDKFMEKEGDKWCVRCALGNAKSAFDKEHSQYDMPIPDLLNQYLKGFSETNYDKPLIDVRDYLASLNPDLLFFTKEDAIGFMLNAANRLNV